MARYTISQLSKKDSPIYLNDIELLYEIVRERKSSCTNYYSPLYTRLTDLQNKLQDSARKGKENI